MNTWVLIKNFFSHHDSVSYGRKVIELKNQCVIALILFTNNKSYKLFFYDRCYVTLVLVLKTYPIAWYKSLSYPLLQLTCTPNGLTHGTVCTCTGHGVQYGCRDRISIFSCTMLGIAVYRDTHSHVIR